ncbi:MAG: hypothetical protein IH585_04540 [Anaerolineaceae bacterium]|nr:hypothetical protein [Anaerolineaceae bacterium]
MSLVLNDHIVLTDLAYEKARLLGMSLVSEHATIPPAAPVRPYLSQVNLTGERVRLTEVTGQTNPAKTHDHQGSAAGFLPSQPDTSTDPYLLRLQLQQQIGVQFPNLDKALLNEMIERVLRRFGIG